MSEDVFRWAITAGVALSWVTMLVTAGGMLGVYRASKRLEGRIGPLLGKGGPILDSAREMVNEARPRIEDMVVKASEMTAMAREQVVRLDALVSETTERARIQIE